MPATGYSEGTAVRLVQEISIANVKAGTKPELWKVPEGFFGRWRYIHWVMTLNTADATFRAWFLNVLDPSGADAGQIIPGIAAVGGASAPTNSPVHEFMDATLPVFFDQVFQGGAGVQPMWDYSGIGNIWYPAGFSFQFDASQLVPGDSVNGLNGLVELIETSPLDSAFTQVARGAVPWLLNTPGN